MVGIPDFVFRSPHTKKQSNFAAATRRLAHVRGSTGGSTRGSGDKRNFSGTRRGPDGAAAGGTRKLNPRPSSQSRSEVGLPHYPETPVYTTCLSWSTIGMALAPAGPDVSSVQQHPLRRTLAHVDTPERAISMSSSAGHEDTGAILLASPRTQYTSSWLLVTTRLVARSTCRRLLLPDTGSPPRSFLQAEPLHE